MRSARADRGPSSFVAPSLALLLTLAGLTAGCDSTYQAPLPRQHASAAQPALAAAALSDLVREIDAGDPDAAAGLAPDGDSSAQDLLAAVTHNAERMRVADLEMRYVDELGAVAADGSWTAAVSMTWALTGFDTEPAHAEVAVDFAADGDRVAITGFGGHDHISPLWLMGPVAVRRTTDVLVLAAGPGSARTARTYADRAAAGIRQVRTTLPRWQPSVVLEIPGAASELDTVLGVADGTYDDIAAVTATADGSGARGAPVRVFVNSRVTDRLRGVGAQVVLTHELVHVATDAPATSVPPWLLEGFADYVALRAVDLPVQTTAAAAIAWVRRHGVPTDLPSAADFDTSARDLEAAYELAWLACVSIADLAGPDGLRGFYERVRSGDSVDVALAGIGLRRGEVLREWRQRLATLSS